MNESVGASELFLGFICNCLSFHNCKDLFHFYFCLLYKHATNVCQVFEQYGYYVWHKFKKRVG